MKKIFTTWSCFLFYFGCFAQTPISDPHWVLQWSDNFKTDGFTKNGWVLSKGGVDYWEIVNDFDHGGEPQVYLNANTTVDVTKGVVLTAQQQNYFCIPCTGVDSYQDHHYTSGQINSLLGIREIQYGYLEAKIRLSDTYGLFPAFWTWTDVGGSDYEEIDIFEMIPGNLQGCQEFSPYYGITHNKNYMTSNLHTADNEPGCTGLENDRGQVNAINDYTVAHTYAVEWTPSEIIFYLDGIVFRNSKNPGIDNLTKIILNLALNKTVKWDSEGDFNPTDPDYAAYFESTTYSPDNINTVPSTMEIEYIKYYKLNFDCSNPLTVTSGNYNTSVMDVVKQSLTTSGTISLPAGYTHQYWSAADYILINGDFTVPLGSELYLDVNPCY